MRKIMDRYIGRFDRSREGMADRPYFYNERATLRRVVETVLSV